MDGDMDDRVAPVLDTILEAVGNTPLVRLHRVTAELPCPVYAKVEYLNPGLSVKDRIAWYIIRRAEEEGLLKPGGTIIEATSGNTGMGLALVAAVRGYRCVFTITDKQSQAKIDALRALGAEVIVCPTDVPPEDPRSYYSVARRLARETPNAFFVNQYSNRWNPEAHYRTTGPEIWRQTEGRITHFVAGVGTGGTISGVGRYLKERKPDVQIWGVDTYGSVLTHYHQTGEYDPSLIRPYLTEGIGEDIIPDTVDFSVIDRFVQVDDREGALWARRLAREEGIWAGWSSGSVLAGLYKLRHLLTEQDMVVVLFPDHGSRYLAKIFSDQWMRQQGWLNISSP